MASWAVDNDADAGTDVESEAEGGGDGTDIDTDTDVDVDVDADADADADAYEIWSSQESLRTAVDGPVEAVACRTNSEVDVHLVTAS